MRVFSEILHKDKELFSRFVELMTAMGLEFDTEYFDTQEMADAKETARAKLEKEALERIGGDASLMDSSRNYEHNRRPSRIEEEEEECPQESSPKTTGRVDVESDASDLSDETNMKQEAVTTNGSSLKSFTYSGSRMPPKELEAFKRDRTDTQIVGDDKPRTTSSKVGKYRTCRRKVILPKRWPRIGAIRRMHSL